MRDPCVRLWRWQLIGGYDEGKRNVDVTGKFRPQLCQGLELTLNEEDGFFVEEPNAPKLGVLRFQGSAVSVLDGPPKVIDPSAPPKESVAESGGPKALSGARDRP